MTYDELPDDVKELTLDWTLSRDGIAVDAYQAGLRDANRDNLFERAAIAAMQGMLAYSPTNAPNGDYHTNATAEQVAQAAVVYAAALVAAIKKERDGAK